MNKNNLALLEGYICLLEMNGMRKNTMTGYESDIKGFLTYIGDTDIKDVNMKKINEWMLSIVGRDGEPIKQSTKNRKIAALKGLYAYLQDEAGIKDIMSKVKTPEPTDTTKKEVLTEKEVDKIEKILNKHVLNPPTPMGCIVENAKMNALRDRAMIMLMFSTGMRISEVLDLELNQVSYNKETGKLKIFIPAAKNKSKRNKYIPVMSNKVYEYIIEYRNNLTFNPNNKYVFLSQNGNKLDTGNVTKTMDKYISEAGIDKHISTHCIRHTFASIRANKKDMNIAQLANALGHKDTKMLMKTYFHDDNESDEGFECAIM